MENDNGKDSLKDLTIDEIIQRAISREEGLRSFYSAAMEDVGPDAVAVFSELALQQNERIQTLHSLLAEVEELRELSLAMVG